MRVYRDTYEVVHNICYGGFSLPQAFVEKVFEAFPPETPLGKKLFENTRESRFIEEGATPNPSWGTYNVIKRKEPFCHGYQRYVSVMYIDSGSGTFKPILKESNKYVSKDGEVFYYLAENRFCDTWRSAPEIVQMMKEEGLIGNKFGNSYLAIDKVPVGYDFDIEDYDGKETVRMFFPYRKVIGELLEAVRSQNTEGLGDLSKMLLSGEVNVKDI